MYVPYMRDTDAANHHSAHNILQYFTRVVLRICISLHDAEHHTLKLRSFFLRTVYFSPLGITFRENRTLISRILEMSLPCYKNYENLGLTALELINCEILMGGKLYDSSRV